MFHVAAHDPDRVFQGNGRAGPEALTLEAAVESLQLAVALRIIRAGAHVRHPAKANEVLEVLGHELRAVNAQPKDQRANGNLPPLVPTADAIDHFLAGVVGDPASFQSSPEAFFCADSVNRQRANVMVFIMVPLSPRSDWRAGSSFGQVK